MTEPRPEDVAAALQHGVAPSRLLTEPEVGAGPDGSEAPRRNAPEDVEQE